MPQADLKEVTTEREAPTEARIPLAGHARSSRPHRPAGWARSYARLFSPAAIVASQSVVDRDADLRVRRLSAAASDRIGQRMRPTRRRMRALTLSPGARLQWRSVPVPPPPGPHGAIVHPIAIATCDMDPMIALGSTPFPLPLHLGHECVAEVLSIGSDVDNVRPGDRVVVPFQISCGACAACRSGRTANCTAVPPSSMYGFGLAGGHWGGALSDELAVPFADAMLVKLPGGIEPAAAASVGDNVSDGYRHVARHLPPLLEEDPDVQVLVLGAVSARAKYSASVPLYAAIAARALGARRITVADARPGAREHAERLGIEAIEPGELKDRPPARLVAEVSGKPPGLRLALESAADDGIVSSSGTLHASARIPTLRMYAHNASLHLGRTHARAVMPEVLDLMSQGRLQPETITTCLAPIDEAPAALRDHFVRGGTKTILTA
ncbi:MAG: alcohol dehydrogenase catalytic domain-containing protein [Thermoleophilaceae bacterium]